MEILEITEFLADSFQNVHDNIINVLLYKKI